MKNKQHTTTAGEDYLESVLILQKKLGMVRSVDVARYMEVSKPSVCYAVGTLREVLNTEIRPKEKPSWDGLEKWLAKIGKNLP